MRILSVLSFMFLLMLPITQAVAQKTDTVSTLGVKLTNTAPFSYKDDEGYTIVIGEVENTKSFPITNVKVWVGFYSGKASGSSGESPLETVTGNTVLETIPAKGTSPFVIKSTTPDPEISEIAVNLLGFNSATQKQQLLEIVPGALSIGETIKLSTNIKNQGPEESTNTRIHLIGFDAFSPPRIVGIQTIKVDDILSKKNQNAEFNVKMDPRASTFKLIAESDNYQSKISDVNDVSLDTLMRLITIDDVSVVDSSGAKVSRIKVGTSVNIESELGIQFSVMTNPIQKYVYYAQVKQFGEKAPVEFLTMTEGEFKSSNPQTATVTWTPQHEGAFFIEGYVWDDDGIALASPSKTISIILVTP